jgi:hypothetical protein
MSKTVERETKNMFRISVIEGWLLFDYCPPCTVLVQGSLPCTMLGTGLSAWSLFFKASFIQVIL